MHWKRAVMDKKLELENAKKILHWKRALTDKKIEEMARKFEFDWYF